jgi:hypothetical protein
MPQLRAELAAKIGSIKVRDDPFVECVDDAYLHGFERVSIRERLRDALRRQRAGSAENADEVQKRPENIRPHDRCAPGQGMKQTPGAFGARSCQPLGTVYLAGDKNAFGSGSEDGAASLAAFENRVSAVAGAAAAAAAERIGNEMSESDRQACLAVAYEQARDVLRVASPKFPQNARRSPTPHLASSAIMRALTPMIPIQGSKSCWRVSTAGLVSAVPLPAWKD